ncbi:hypothetical protein [Nocardiopsis sp. CNT312]|uniref:hypothetical protein n=1 Tax=Nocardiopsis sp. CNT312 TaxID=1137268 RepID=UPI000491C917|nr:hypothetical protein [Nocardiopsis sp. CNT312]
MEWVTYLSPSGGGERLGAVDDGDVLGCPGESGLAALLDAGPEALASARARALDAPLEIIAEPEARVCAPLVPEEPVMVGLHGAEAAVHPGLVRGVDDGVASGARRARVGLAAVSGSGGARDAFTIACLWLDASGEPVQLTLGPRLVTADGLRADPECSVFVADEPVGFAVLTLAGPWPTGGAHRVRVLPLVETPSLEEGDEVAVDAGELGGFGVRVGSRV